jgi:hypothetical protein
MKKMIAIIMLCGLLIISCEKDAFSAEYPYEAEVIGRNSDCGIYAVKILKGLSQVQTSIGSNIGDSIYIAKNLPTELETVGLKIMLDIRKPNDDELGPCTTFGPAYHWLFVKRAEKKGTSAKG